MSKNPKIFLEHILTSIQAIQDYAKDETLETFLTNIKDQDAVIRRLEIIGEAVKNLPEDFKKRQTDIPWIKIAGMRDILIHEYFAVDIPAVWGTVQSDLPDLRIKIENLLKFVSS